MKKQISFRIRFSLLLKLIVAVSALYGTWLSAGAGRNSFMGGSSVFMFFTIQSNIALAILSLAGIVLLLQKKPIRHAFQVIKLVGTVSITLTGMVFCFVLAPTMTRGAWNPQNILTHVVVPLLSVFDFFVVGIDYSYEKADVLWVILPPLLYAIYAAVGYVQNWQFMPGKNYPYFFLNWGSEAGAFGFCKGLPFMGTAWWILALLLFLLLVGELYRQIGKLLRKIFP